MEESHLVSAVSSLGTVITKSRRGPVLARSNALDGMGKYGMYGMYAENYLNREPGFLLLVSAVSGVSGIAQVQVSQCRTDS